MELTVYALPQLVTNAKTDFGCVFLKKRRKAESQNDRGRLRFYFSLQPSAFSHLFPLEKPFERARQFRGIPEVQRLNQERVCPQAVGIVYVSYFVRAGKHYHTQV